MNFDTAFERLLGHEGAYSFQACFRVPLGMNHLEGSQPLEILDATVVIGTSK